MLDSLLCSRQHAFLNAMREDFGPLPEIGRRCGVGLQDVVRWAGSFVFRWRFLQAEALRAMWRRVTGQSSDPQPAPQVTSPRRSRSKYADLCPRPHPNHSPEEVERLCWILDESHAAHRAATAEDMEARCGKSQWPNPNGQSPQCSIELP